jgi:hypothetical protein
MQAILVNVNDGADASTKQAAHTLVTALNDNGIEAKLDNDTADKAIVDMIIGLKP